MLQIKTALTEKGYEVSGDIEATFGDIFVENGQPKRSMTFYFCPEFPLNIASSSTDSSSIALEAIEEILRQVRIKLESGMRNS